MVNSDTGASEDRRPTEVSTEVFMVTTEVAAPGWSEAEESALGRRQSARRRAVSARHPSGEGAPLAPRGLQPWSERQVGLWESVWQRHAPLQAGGYF